MSLLGLSKQTDSTGFYYLQGSYHQPESKNQSLLLTLEQHSSPQMTNSQTFVPTPAPQAVLRAPGNTHLLARLPPGQ